MSKPFVLGTPLDPGRLGTAVDVWAACRARLQAHQLRGRPPSPDAPDMSHEYTTEYAAEYTTVSQFLPPWGAQSLLVAGSAPSCPIDLSAPAIPAPLVAPGCSLDNPIDLTANGGRPEDVVMANDENCSSVVFPGLHRRKLGSLARKATKESSHSATLLGAVRETPYPDSRGDAMKAFSKKLLSTKCGSCHHGMEWQAAEVVSRTKEMVMKQGRLHLISASPPMARLANEQPQAV